MIMASAAQYIMACEQQRDNAPWSGVAPCFFDRVVPTTPSAGRIVQISEFLANFAGVWPPGGNIFLGDDNPSAQI
jgi:hypothetical protein